MKPEKSVELMAAEWLIVGFVRSWTWQMLAITVREATGQHLESFPFFPTGRTNWRGSAPVRGYVAQNWPRLAEFLDTAPMDRKIGAAKEILKLRWNGNLSTGSLNGAERSEIARIKRNLRQATTSYNESRRIFKAHSKTQWGVCK